MIVTCPNCGTRYKMPEGMALAGKRMRCAECDHRWQLPMADEEDELASAQQALREAPPIQPVMPEPELSAVEADDAPAQADEIEDALAPEDESRPRNLLAWGSTLVVAVALGLLAGAIWLERLDPARIPVVGGVLADLQPAPSSLSLSLQARLTPMANGKLLLEIEGEIKNVAAAPRTLTPLKATLAGPSGIVRRWTIAPPAAQLAGGASAGFSSTLADVPAGHRMVRVTGG